MLRIIPSTVFNDTIEFLLGIIVSHVIYYCPERFPQRDREIKALLCVDSLPKVTYTTLK